MTHTHPGTGFDGVDGVTLTIGDTVRAPLNPDNPNEKTICRVQDRRRENDGDGILLVTPLDTDQPQWVYALSCWPDNGTTEGKTVMATRCFICDKMFHSWSLYPWVVQEQHQEHMQRCHPEAV